jgi:hypothetical protein
LRLPQPQLRQCRPQPKAARPSARPLRRSSRGAVQPLQPGLGHGQPGPGDLALFARRGAAADGLEHAAHQPRWHPRLFRQLPEDQPVGSIDTSNVRIGCNTASRTGTWTVRLTDPTTRQSRDVKARYSFIYVYENGEWKIDHLHSSMMPEQTTQTATSAK